MDLKHARKLTQGDQFRRPSQNPHDEGWRVYTVQSVNYGYDVHGSVLKTPCSLMVCDQHGYHSRVGLMPEEWRNDTRKWMLPAERLPTQ